MDGISEAELADVNSDHWVCIACVIPDNVFRRIPPSKNGMSQKTAPEIEEKGQCPGHKEDKPFHLPEALL